METWESSLIGRFRVEGVLGRGGMGVVLRAFDPQLRRAVAIKVLSSAVGGTFNDGNTIDLRTNPPNNDLLAEARALAQITDPNVLAVHEIGSDRGKTFLVMELVEGVHLGEWLRARPRTLPEILDVFAQAGRGLAAAHRRGLVHRDFKPENVLIDPSGRVRVCDFGIASFAVGNVRSGTAGTPAYMAPELWTDAPATVQSDIYAFAVTFVEAVGDLEAVDEPLRAIVERALAPKPEDRPPTIDALVDAMTRPERLRVRWPIAIACAASLGIATMFVATSRKESFDCGDANALVHARWRDDTRASVRTAVAAPVADPVVANLDAYAARWKAARDRACTLAEPLDRKRARLACLDRRLAMFGATVAAVGSAPSGEIAVSRSASTQDVASCDVIVDETTPAPEVEPLLAELLRLEDRARAAPGSVAELAQLRVLEARAEALGDADTIVYARILHGHVLGNAGKLGEAEAAFDAATAFAHAQHRDLLEASAAIHAARIAMNRGDRGGAAEKLKLARGIAERAPLSARARTTLFLMIGRNETDRARLVEAEAALVEARRVNDSAQPRDGLLAGQIAFEHARMLVERGRLDDAYPRAREAEALLRPLGAPAVNDLGATLALLGNIEHARGNFTKQREHIRARAALYEAAVPPNHPLAIASRDDIGLALLAEEDYAGALAAFEDAHRRAKSVEAAAAFRGQIRMHSAKALVGLDRIADARTALHLAIEEQRAHDANSPALAGYLAMLAQLELDAGRLDEAAVQLAAAERQIAPFEHDRDERIAVTAARLALVLARREYAQADELAGREQAILVERGVTDARLEPLMLAGARAKLELGKVAEARALVEHVLAAARKRDDAIGTALVELELAYVTYRVDKAGAIATLRRLEPLLAASPRARTEHRRLARWLRTNKIRI